MQAKRTDSDPYWVNLGWQAYGLNRDGALIAVLYWEPATPQEGPDDEIQILAAAWYLVYVDAPDVHEHVCDAANDDSGSQNALAGAQVMAEDRPMGAGRG